MGSSIASNQGMPLPPVIPPLHFQLNRALVHPPLTHTHEQRFAGEQDRELPMKHGVIDG